MQQINNECNKSNIDFGVVKPYTIYIAKHKTNNKRESTCQKNS
jgi:hypothetical protein